MKRRVRVGEDFELEVPTLDGKCELAREKTRSAIAMVTTVMVIVFLLGAAIIGLLDGSYDELRTVWDIVATPIGGLITFYFTDPGA